MGVQGDVNMEQTSLSEALDESVQDDDNVAAAPAEVTSEAAGAPAEPEKGEEPETPSADETMVPIAALEDERRKRQALENEKQFWAEMKTRNEQQPESGNEGIDDSVEPVDQLRSEMQQAMVNERFNMSERFARNQHGDDIVTAAADAFQSAAKDNPALAASIQQQGDPYGYVINWHKQQQTLKEVGSVDDLRAKIEAEVTAKIEAKYAAKAEAANMPPNLANEASGGVTSTGWGGPTSLDDIL